MRLERTVSVGIGRTSKVKDALNRLAAWTFGPTPTSTFSPSRLVLAVVLALSGALIAFLRLPAGTRSVLWAEDARVFITGALAHYPFGAIFEPYAGYMHAFPRVAALLATSFLPLGLVPAAVTVIACALTGFTASLAFVLLRSRIQPVMPRLAVWLGIAVAPVAGIEVNGSIANSHWYLLIALFVVLMTRQRHAALIAVSAVTVAFAVMSDPLSAIFAPLVLLRLVTMRSRRELVIPLVYVASLVVQLSVVASTTVGSSGAHASFEPLARATGFRVFLAAVAGETGAVSLYKALGIGSLAIAVVVVVLLVAFSAVNRSQLGGLAVASLAWSIVFFVLAVFIRWKELFDPQVSLGWGASRYSVLPTALITIAFACAAATVYANRSTIPAVKIATGVALVVWITVLVVPAFFLTARYPGQPWSVELANSVKACEARPAKTLVIPTSPANWGVTVTCRDLLQKQ